MRLRCLKALVPSAVVVCSLMATGCDVHEFPHMPDTRNLVLRVTHNQGWSEYDHMISRGVTPENTILRYHFLVTPHDDPKVKISDTTIYSTDLSRPDFTTSLKIPAGTYDIWAWSDHAHSDTRESVHHDSRDFENIVYTQPYSGNDDRRDAFRGMTTVSVSASTDEEINVSGTIALERPLAKYRVIATDLREFVEDEMSRKSLTLADGPDLSPLLGSYTVKVRYTGYMPSKFNNFINRPVDSATGVTFEGAISQISETEAQLTFDYVMVNGHESSIPVSLEVYDGDMMIARTGTINVPIVRNRITNVRGKFLTSLATGGIGINPDFDGEFNIEIR